MGVGRAFAGTAGLFYHDIDPVHYSIANRDFTTDIVQFGRQFIAPFFQIHELLLLCSI
jgi:hypothetical protein